MKKIFVQYPSFRSSTKKYDPYVARERGRFNYRAQQVMECNKIISADKIKSMKTY